MTSTPRLKDLGRWLSGGTPPKANEAAWSGDVPWISAKDLDATILRDPTTFITEEAAARHSTIVEPGAILMLVRGMALAHGLPVVLADRRLAFNQDLKALVPPPGAHPRFLYYAFLASRDRFDAHIDKAAHGTARVIDSLYSERVRLPPLERQTQVAAFLDLEVHRIRDLLARTALLTTRTQQALVNEAGRLILDRDAPTPRIGYLFAVVSGKTLSGGLAGLEDDVQPFIGTGHIRWGHVVAADFKHTSFTPEEQRRLTLRRGDLLVNEGGAGSGRAAVLEADVPGVHFQNHVHRLRALRPLEPDYFRWAIQALHARGALLLDSFGIGLPNLSGSRLKAFRVPVPSLEVQRAVVRRLRDEERRLSAITSSAGKLSERLTEYKASLVREAVTGKLDPRTYDSQTLERVQAASERAFA